MLPGVSAGDPLAVHRARVATRRLRELLPLVQLDGHAAQKLGKRLRKVTRRLAAARELDAILALLDGELASAAPQAQSRLRAVLGARRQRARARLAAKSVANDLPRLVRKLESVAERLDEADKSRAGLSPAVDRQWRWAVDARVAHRAGALRKAIADAGAVYLPERLHKVRIALKKLRYGLEVAVEADGLNNRADLRKLKQAQEVLGQMRDLQVLADRARQVQAIPSGRTGSSGTLARLAPWRELDGLIDRSRTSAGGSTPGSCASVRTCSPFAMGCERPLPIGQRRLVGAVSPRGVQGSEQNGRRLRVVPHPTRRGRRAGR